MFKIVIVDDEINILQGLVETYDWEGMGFEVTGSALSAEEALSLIERTQPDILITDIRMRDMDGLQLIDEVQKTNARMKYIVISAFKDFEYARKACELGSFSYLVKPFDDGELEQTMRNMYQQCLAEREKEEEYTLWHDILLENSDGYEALIVEKYVKGKVTEKELAGVLKVSQSEPEEEDCFAAICADIDITYKVTNQVEYESRRFALSNYLTGELGSKYKLWVIAEPDGRYIYILNVKKLGSLIPLRKRMEEAKNRLQLPVISSISNIHHGLAGLKEAYGQAEQMFEVAKMAGAGAFLVPQQVSIREQDADNSGIAFRITDAFRKNEKEELKQSMIQYIYSLPEGFQLEEGRRSLHRLALECEGIAGNDSGKIFEGFYINLFQIPLTKAIDILWKILDQLIEERLDSQGESEAVYFNDYIERALQYIENNLGNEKLSLSRTAEEVYLNAAYFGRLFKQSAGVSFKQYVLERRLQQAKVLLDTTSKSIQEIAEETGIPNSSYFSNLFKQKTGVLPSEYRK